MSSFVTIRRLECIISWFITRYQKVLSDNMIYWRMKLFSSQILIMIKTIQYNLFEAKNSFLKHSHTEEWIMFCKLESLFVALYSFKDVTEVEYVAWFKRWNDWSLLIGHKFVKTIELDFTQSSIYYLGHIISLLIPLTLWIFATDLGL